MFDPEGGLGARLASVPAGPQLATALDALDPSCLDGGQQVDVLVALARQAAHTQARLLAGMAAVAARSVGIGFDSDEVAFALHLTRRGAQNQVALAQDLLSRLPMVWTALERGELCPARARTFSDVLTAAPDDLARDIAERLLPAATAMTAGQLRARLLRELLKADPGLAAERYERSVRERRVHLTGNDDTTACLSGIFLPPAKAAAGYERVDAIARSLKRDGDTRTLDQLRADAYCDLLAGVGIGAGVGAAAIARPGVVELLVPLETLTGQSDTPGHLAGYGPVIADIARQVATQQAHQQHADATAAAQAAARLARALGPDDPATSIPVAQWRYRVCDHDGRLLYTGLTRARPTAAGEAEVSDAEVSDADGSEPLFDLAAINAAARPVDRRAEPVAPGVLALRPLDPNPPTPERPASSAGSAPTAGPTRSTPTHPGDAGARYVLRGYFAVAPPHAGRAALRPSALPVHCGCSWNERQAGRLARCAYPSKGIVRFELFQREAEQNRVQVHELDM